MCRRTPCERTLQYIGPVIWNSLPVSVRHTSSLCYFKSKLKTHLFSSLIFFFLLICTKPITNYMGVCGVCTHIYACVRACVCVCMRAYMHFGVCIICSCFCVCCVSFNKFLTKLCGRSVGNEWENEWIWQCFSQANHERNKGTSFLNIRFVQQVEEIKMKHENQGSCFRKPHWFSYIDFFKLCFVSTVSETWCTKQHQVSLITCKNS